MNCSSLPHNHGHSRDAIIKTMPNEEKIFAVSQAIKQLSDPSRLRIFLLLCHYEECVLNIADITGMSSPAVSHHLRQLKSIGLICSKRVGKEVYYHRAENALAYTLYNMIRKLIKITCPKNNAD